MSLGRRKLARRELEERRLSRAVRAENARPRAFGEMRGDTAEKRYAELLSAISGWRALAQTLNIRRSEVDRMSQCFCKAEFR